MEAAYGRRVMGERPHIQGAPKGTVFLKGVRGGFGGEIPGESPDDSARAGSRGMT